MSHKIRFFLYLLPVFALAFFASTSSAFAANRYWVGDTGNWSDTAHWAATSGAAGGETVPTASDDVFFDANSTGTVTVNTSATTNNLDFSSSSITFAGSSALAISGNLTMSATMTRSYTGAITFNATSGTKTITSNGIAFGSGLSTITFSGTGGTWQLQDAFTSGTTVNINSGTLDTNGVAVSIGNLQSIVSTAATLSLGASTLTFTGAVGWSTSNANLTFNVGSSTIVFNGSQSLGISGATGYAFNDVSFSAPTTLVFSGINTFHNLTITPTAAKTNTISLNADQTITGTLTITGNSLANRPIIKSNTVGTARTLTAAAVSLTNVDFMDITGAGAATWTGTSLGDANGNTNITFTTPVTRYGVVAGNWSATSTWSDSSGGAAGSSAPLPQDDVVLDASSAGTYTGDRARLGKNITMTNFAGTFSNSQSSNVYGSLALGAGMTLSAGNNTLTLSGRNSFNLTTNGLVNTTMSYTIDAPGGTYTLQDALNIGATRILTLTNGTLNTNGQTVTTGAFSSSNSNTRALTLGATTWSATTWTMTTFSGMTLSAASSTITTTGAVALGGGFTYGSFTSSGTSNLSLAGNLTFAGTLTLTGTAANSRMLVLSDTVGTARTLTAAVVSLTNVDFMDITGAGAATWSGTVLGDAQGNSGITFTPATTRYAVATGSNWFATSTWATSSGGSAGASTPLPQDDVFVDANAGSGTLTIASTDRLGKNIDFTGFTGTFQFSTLGTVYGSLTYSPTMSMGQSQKLTLRGRGSYTLTNAGQTNNTGFIIDAPGGTYTLQDDHYSNTSNGDLTLTNGTFNANNHNVTVTGVTISGTNTRGLTMGSGTWTLTSGMWFATTVTGLTFNANTSTVKFSAVTQIFSGGGLTYNNLWLAATSTGIYSIVGSNTFNDFKMNTPPHTINFTAGNTQTVTTFTVAGTSGNLITLQSGTSGSAWNIAKAGGGTIGSDYLSVKDSAATPGSTWYAGTNSTNVSGNTGWTFTDAPSPNTAPTASISTPSQTSTSTVSFTATVSDPDLNATSLLVEYSRDNSTWASSTLGAVTADVGTVATSSGQITSIDTNTSTTTLTITWNTGTDLPSVSDTSVYLRIRPNDGTESGSTQTSSAFLVDTTTPAVPTATGYNADSRTQLTISWTSSQTQFATDNLTSGTTEYTSSSPAVFTGLTCSKTYTFRVKAGNLAGDYSAYTSEFTGRTLTCPSSSGGGGGGSSGGTSSSGSTTTPTTPTTSTATTTPTTSSSGGSPAATSTPTTPLSIPTIPANLSTLPKAEQIAILQSVLQYLIAQLKAQTPITPPVLSTLDLQRFLNSHGFIIALSGPGSPGHETNVLGSLTRAALIKFQISKGIIKTATSDGAGVFGPRTKASINGR